jgi:hypothetical protein
MRRQSTLVLLVASLVFIAPGISTTAVADLIASWGSDQDGLVSNTPTGSDFTAIAASNHHATALRSNGSIVSWGIDELAPTPGAVSETPTGNGELRTDSKAIFDYPENGPKDIYELGVPKSAKILDYSPTPELLEVMEAYRFHRDNAPARYIVIVVYANEQIASETFVIDGLETFYFDGINRRRLEVLRFDAVSQQKFSAQCGDSFDSLLKWQRDQGKPEFRMWMDEISMYDGRYRYSQQRSSSKTWSRLKKVYVPSDGYRLPMGDLIFWRDTLSELGWPNSLLHGVHGRGRTSIVENDHSRNNNLVCVEVLYDEFRRDNKVIEPAKKRLYYLNPQREYICERQEIQPQPGIAQSPEAWIDKVGAMRAFDGLFSVGEVVEYGRSDLHQWFPKRILMRFRWENPDQTIEERKKMIIVYLNTNPEFPDRIFDPNNLP